MTAEPHPSSRQRTTLAALLFVISTGCAIVHEPAWPEPVPESALDRSFTREQLAEDLADARTFVETVHPAPYERAPKERIDAAEREALAGIDHPLTRREFAPAFARFLAAFDDGHTSGGFPREDFSRFARRNGRFVPFDAVQNGTVTRVGPVYEPVQDLAPGDCLVSLDGTPIETWLERLMACRSGPLEWRSAGVCEGLRSQLWLHGVVPPVDVVWEKPDGRRVQRSLQGIPWHDRGEGHVLAHKNFDFRVLEGNVGLIDFRSMAGRDEWLAFLATTFAGVRDKHLAGLVIDLRANGGGDSTLGQDLLEYLTDKPYRMAARKEWKSSAPYREFMKSRVSAVIRWLPLQWFHAMGRKLWGADEGEIVVFDTEPAVPAPDEAMPLRFRGPCVFLIGPRTFSSALMLADAVATAKLAALMGEETAECPTGFGEVMPHVVPHSRLQFQVSSARFVRANGDSNDRSGVVPDVAVKQSADDLRNGVDTALQTARRHVLEQTAAHRGG